MPGFRPVTTLLVFTLFAVFFLYKRIKKEPGLACYDPRHLYPDFNNYLPHRTLSKAEFPVDIPNKRVIIIGDLHGMLDSLINLLDKVHYDSTRDTLIHVGDLMPKGPGEGSMELFDYLITNNVTGVRGNNDQHVLAWRTWMNWIQTLSGGPSWLELLVDSAKFGTPHEPWVPHADRKWWHRIICDWDIDKPHFLQAWHLTAAEYEYLLGLPVLLHAPHAHAFIMHAGVMPHNPDYPIADHSQPLARVPVLPPNNSAAPNHAEIDELRHAQELSVLNDIPQNREFYNLLNMRTVLDDHTVTRKKKGAPWSILWNKDMERCKGFEAHDRIAEVHHPGHPRLDQSLVDMDVPLPCYPVTAIYGHAATRGLNIQRWSFGLDTGCVYGQRLTSLVIPGCRAGVADCGADNVDYDEVMPFGDDRRAYRVSVSCGEVPNEDGKL